MKWWHRWRAEIWKHKAYVARGEEVFLDQLAKFSGNSYYADKLHDAVCKRLQAENVLWYHKDKAA